MADFRGKILESRIDGTLLSLNGREVETMFTGRFNAYNLTAVYGACIMPGWDETEVLRQMSRLVPVSGRFQAIHSPKRSDGDSGLCTYARCSGQCVAGHTRSQPPACYHGGWVPAKTAIAASGQYGC